MNMKPAPKLSIVTVNLNQAAGLTQTFDSVRAQTFRDFEHIVVDGGSTDGSLEVIKARSDGLAFWVSEPDAGIYAAMNKGLRRAQGEYVYFLNSGDRLYSPDTLERVFAHEERGEDLLYGNTVRPDAAGNLYEHRHPDVLTVGVFWDFGVCQQAIFYRRELFAALGEFDESFQIAGDWDFDLRVLMARRTTRHLPFPVAHYQGGGISTTRKDLAAREKEIIWRRHLPEAVYWDYERLMFLEKEYRQLKSLKGWAASFPAILLDFLANGKSKVGL